MGFTQRQAAGKFTRDEADEFIERLQSEVYGEEPPSRPDASVPLRPPTSKIAPRPQSANSAQSGQPRIVLDDVPAEVLAAELQRRGWVVLNPD